VPFHAPICRHAEPEWAHRDEHRHIWFAEPGDRPLLAPSGSGVVYCGGILPISGIGDSRLALRYHAPAEAAACLIIGAGAVASFRIMLAKRRAITLPVQRLIRGAVILPTLLYEERRPVEHVLWDVAGFLRFLAPMCS
jgi:hypothetical protein